MIEYEKGGEALPLNKSGNRRGFNDKGKVGRKKKEPTVVLSIRIPAAWLELFGGDKEAAAMYAKSALELVANGGIRNP